MAYVERKIKVNQISSDCKTEMLYSILLTMRFGPAFNAVKEKASFNQINVFMESLSFEREKVHNEEFMHILTAHKFDNLDSLK